MIPMPASRSVHPVIATGLQACRRAFWSVAIYSGLVNALMLAGPLYMLQIYDRVLSAHSVPTLVALSIGMLGAYAFQGALDLVRSRIVSRIAALLDRQLGTTIHNAVVKLSTHGRPGEASHPVRDIDQIRTFLTSPGPIAIVDLPWTPVFLALCFLIHPWLGMVALFGGVALFTLTLITERSSRLPTRTAGQESAQRAALIEATRRNSESIIAMGMTGALGGRWTDINDRHLHAAQRLSDVVSSYSSISRIVRLALQSLILGLGAYLVIHQELTPGAMIAASIMMGRALAPIETAIANWRGFIAARQAIARLSDMLSRLIPKIKPMPLPRPVGTLDVEGVSAAAPNAQAVIVGQVQFKLSAGEALGIVGPSGAGKTSLLRTLVGIWRPARGTVRLDGAALENWDQDALGRDIGFVSQNVELFDGTVAENISRMQEEPDAAEILEAAQSAGAHDMILRLANGYDTKIGEAGAVLSAGQRQRVAFARALYGKPFLVALDEPNSNLDSEGEAALQQAIRDLKARGAIVLLVAHRPSALAECDKVLFIANGRQQLFGPRDEVLRKAMARPSPMPVPMSATIPGNLKVVHGATGGAADGAR